MEPCLNWIIRTPESLFYPGVHTGNINVQIRGKQGFDDRVVCLRWKSPIFLPFVSAKGLVSSDGPFEESSRYTEFTRYPESMANMLVIGPYSTPGDANMAPIGFILTLGTRCQGISGPLPQMLSVEQRCFSSVRMILVFLARINFLVSGFWIVAE